MRVVAMGAPIAAVVVVAAWRIAGAMSANTAASAGIVATLAVAVIAWRVVVARRAIDDAWLVRTLDASDPAFQDSADLLLANPAALGDLARLQRERMLQVLDARAARTQRQVREPWPLRRIAAAFAVAMVSIVAIVGWPATAEHPPAATSAPEVASAPLPQSMTSTLRIVPPAYTGLPARDVDTLSARVEEGSALAWSLRFAHEPASARLVSVDGTTLELEASGDAWKATRTLARSTLYRVQIEGAQALPQAPSARLEVIPDRAPRLTVRQPERTLTVVDDGLRQWTIVVEASDDYGLADAQLELVLAQGSGEQVTVTQRRIALRGEGDAKQRRYEHRIDLTALGFAAGDDVIAALQVRDRRAPEPNLARSPSFILRWPPPPPVEGSGVEGLVQKAMPAYFRSQRQIIIDTEALVAKRASLPADDFVVRSDVIGADQRLLRLRYGQFLGEESETEGEAHEEGPGESHGDSVQALMAAAGHLHDLPEAATLLDPGTRALLREALAAMWDAERELRTGAPAAALPHERRALEFIKRAQQADRIYLARVGLDLPQLDDARRLTGERGALAGRRDPAMAADTQRAPDAAWAALQRDELPDLAALSAWATRIAAAETDASADASDPLALLEAIDALQREPDCVPCRATLAQRLWSALTPPAAVPASRTRADAMGNAYLDALAAPESMP